MRIETVAKRRHIEIVQALALRRNERLGVFQNVFQQVLLFQCIDKL